MDLLRVLSSDWKQRAVVADPLELTLRAAFNERGSLTFTTTTESTAFAALSREGARIIATGEHGTWSGALDVEDGPATEQDLEVVYTVADDWGSLMDLPVPVNPDQPGMPTSPSQLGQAVRAEGQTSPVGRIDNQVGYYIWRDIESAEGTVKAAIADALKWWDDDAYRIAPNRGRGGPPAMLPPTRFDRLEDVCVPILEAAGLGLRVVQQIGADGVPEPWITVDVWEPRTYAQTITPGSKIIQSGRYRRDRRPKANAALVGGPGQDAARGYATRRDAASIAMHGVIPGYAEASQQIAKWPKDLEDGLQVEKYLPFRTEVPAEERAAAAKALDDATRQVLAEGAISASIAVQLAETVGFFLGTRVVDGVTETGFLLGEGIPVDVAGVKFTERLRMLTLTQDRNGGQQITPAFGTGTSNEVAVLARAIQKLGRVIASASRSR